MSSRLSLKIVLACVVQLIECAGLEINQHGSQVWVLSQVLNAGVEGSSPSRVTKLFDIINTGQRRSWRGGTDCKSVVVRLSRSESYLTHTSISSWRYAIKEFHKMGWNKGIQKIDKELSSYSGWSDKSIRVPTNVTTEIIWVLFFGMWRNWYPR